MRPSHSIMTSWSRGRGTLLCDLRAPENDCMKNCKFATWRRAAVTAGSARSCMLLNSQEDLQEWSNDFASPAQFALLFSRAEFEKCSAGVASVCSFVQAFIYFPSPHLSPRISTDATVKRLWKRHVCVLPWVKIGGENLNLTARQNPCCNTKWRYI